MNIQLIKDENKNILTPKQVHYLLLTCGKLVQHDDEFEMVLEFVNTEDVISFSVKKELVPGVSEDDVRMLLNDAIYREYTVQYNSARRAAL